jgi:hypothetical protein
MNFYRTRKWMVALLALILVVAMAGCKGESSPTAPTVTPGGGGVTGSTGSTGTVTPPVGATLTLAVSNATPLVDSSSIITATVSSGGAAVPNGTAVEFQTDFGSFVQGASPAVTTIIKTTTSGVARATLFSSAAGAAVVTATVNNVTKAVTITFVPTIVVTPPAPKVLTITGVTPTIGSPNGGQILTITGTNFITPVRVLFDTGAGSTPADMQVVSVTDTVIQVVTPKVNIAAGQQLKMNITVISQQGTSSEQRATLAGAFTFQLDVLTPTPTTASPASGSIDGGTRVTIFGSGFQAPVQVFFGASEAQVIKTTFDQIVVITPTARNAGVTTGSVNIRIINVTSAKTSTLTAGFAYADKMTITAVGPTQGPIAGGTRVTLDGSGFDTGGVAVVIGGIAAQPVFVSGTKLIAITGAPVPTGCANVVGPTQVVNINNGDSATGPSFTFLVSKPVIHSITNPVVRGANAQIVVSGAAGTNRISINGQAVPISGVVDNGNGTSTFTVVVPTNLQLATQACTAVPGVNAFIQTGFDVVFTNVETTCTDTLTKGAVLNPPDQIFAQSPTNGFVAFQTKLTQPGPPIVPGTPAPAQTVTITNAGGGIGGTGLQITSIAQSGCANFSISFPTTPVSLGPCDPFPIQANYNRSVPGSDQCTLTISTSAGTHTLTLSGSAQ